MVADGGASARSPGRRSFYCGEVHVEYLGAAAAVAAGLAVVNHSRIYRVSPYVLLGVLLWTCIHASGLHATLAGIILAIFLPTRPPPNLRALTIALSDRRRLDVVPN
jgi:Na+:H+ antiporter, NhaA family